MFASAPCQIEHRRIVDCDVSPNMASYSPRCGVNPLILDGVSQPFGPIPPPNGSWIPRGVPRIARRARRYDVACAPRLGERPSRLPQRRNLVRAGAGKLRCVPSLPFEGVTYLVGQRRPIVVILEADSGDRPRRPASLLNPAST